MFEKSFFLINIHVSHLKFSHMLFGEFKILMINFPLIYLPKDSKVFYLFPLMKLDVFFYFIFHFFFVSYIIKIINLKISFFMIIIINIYINIVLIIFYISLYILKINSIFNNYNILSKIFINNFTRLFIKVSRTTIIAFIIH